MLHCEPKFIAARVKADSHGAILPEISQWRHRMCGKNSVLEAIPYKPPCYFLNIINVKEKVPKHE